MKVSTRVVSLVLAIVLAVSCLTISVFADGEIKSGVAFVKATALNMRSSPSMDSSVVDIAHRDEVVVILSQSGDWYKVIYNLQEGYMHRDYLNVTTCENVELGYGVINSYCVNLRSGPSTSNSVVAQAYEGAKAYIIGINNGWYKVIYNGTYAYVRSDLLDLTEYPYENRNSSNSPKYYRNGTSISSVSESSENSSTAAQAPATSESQQTAASGTAVVKADALYLRSNATTASAALDIAYRNDTVSLLAQEGVWYKVSFDGQEGYMHGDYLGIGESAATTSTVGQKIVDCAMQYLGVPYVWGGSSPSGFDCSGLVQYVARSCGFSIGRTVTQQWPYGTEVSKDNLQPGDIVFFTNTYTSGFSHVGIYVGDGNFIHSPSSGSVVKISSLDSSYYASHYYGARRLG
ncbi:MAG: SH3 domain-containing protein [Oscillospiraceae bacterium]|nr:SH3 domain-containing protein [Oscillospiraceae bacterium]